MIALEELGYNATVAMLKTIKEKVYYLIWKEIDDQIEAISFEPDGYTRRTSKLIAEHISDSIVDNDNYIIKTLKRIESEMEKYHETDDKNSYNRAYYFTENLRNYIRFDFVKSVNIYIKKILDPKRIDFDALMNIPNINWSLLIHFYNQIKGTSLNDEHYIKYYLKHDLFPKHMSENRLWLSYDEIKKAVNDVIVKGLIPFDKERIITRIVDNILSDTDVFIKIKSPLANIMGQSYVYTLRCLYQDNKKLFDMIYKRVSVTTPYILTSEDRKLMKSTVEQYEVDNDKKLTFEQLEAIYGASQNGQFIITGGSSIDQSEVVSNVIEIVKRKNPQTKIFGTAANNRNIMKLSHHIGFGEQQYAPIKKWLELNHQSSVITTNKLYSIDEIDLLIIDDFTNIPVEMMNDLLNEVPYNTQIIFLGELDNSNQSNLYNYVGLLESEFIQYVDITPAENGERNLINTFNSENYMMVSRDNEKNIYKECAAIYQQLFNEQQNNEPIQVYSSSRKMIKEINKAIQQNLYNQDYLKQTTKDIYSIDKLKIYINDQVRFVEQIELKDRKTNEQRNFSIGTRAQIKDCDEHICVLAINDHLYETVSSNVLKMEHSYTLTLDNTDEIKSKETILCIGYVPIYNKRELLYKGLEKSNGNVTVISSPNMVRKQQNYFENPRTLQQQIMLDIDDA
ncbi:AAA family ATPase [Mammaliicoccus sciuri]|uniref:AAA family ATPase n=1 Tax=Mammaliicoccus sciuri TaxID=1296 RepID=UPI0039E1313E